MSNGANLTGVLDSTSDDAFDMAARWHSLMEDEPSPAERERFEAWLAAEPKNRAAYESVQRTWAGIASAAIDDRILEMRREALSTPQKWRLTFLRPVSIAAIVLVSMAAATGILIRYNPLTARSGAGVHATQVGERSTIALPDGSTVVLNTASRIHVAFDAQARRVQLLAGQAWFEVAKDQPRPFVVEAGDRIVTAHGTAFDVRLEDHDRVQVTLIEGRVSVETVNGSGAGPKILEHEDLFPGDQLTVTAARLGVTRNTDVAKVVSWREGQIIFDDDTLATAVAEVNRYSLKKIILDPRLASLRMSGVFIAGHSDSFVQTVTGHFPIKVTPDSEGQLLLKAAD